MKRSSSRLVSSRLVSSRVYTLFLLFLFFIVIAVFRLTEKADHHAVLKWDVCGYYNYLPALFIYQDIRQFRFFDKIDSIYRPTDGAVARYALYPVGDSGNVCNQYTVGVAIFHLPIFALTYVAHVLADLPYNDGYSKWYQWGVFLSTWLVSLFSFLLLFHWLQRYVSVFSSLMVILLLGIGTNYVNYIAFEPGMSHPYAFFLVSVILFSTDKWYRKARMEYALILGLAVGILAITRPVDVLVVLIPLGWGYVGSRWAFWWRHRWQVLAMLVICILAIMPQLLYWKYVTGLWIYDSYGEEHGFVWHRPRIWQGLFSFRKGWIIYSPLVLLGFVGLFFMNKARKLSWYPILFGVFFLPFMYIVFCWRNWPYGWSYGSRPLIDILPLLALPMGILIERMSGFKRGHQAMWACGLLMLCVLNIFQHWQYTQGILRGDGMTWEYYKRVFLKRSVDAETLDIIKIQEQEDYEKGL